MGQRFKKILPGEQSLTAAQCRYLLFLVLAISAALRLSYLEHVPLGFSHQSIDHHNQVTFKFLAAIHCWFGSGPCPSKLPTFVQQYGFASFLQALVFYIFGVGYLQSTVLAAVFGILSVYFIWKIGSAIIGRDYGLILAFLLSASLWHITFSRHSDAEHSLPVLQALLSVYLGIQCATSPSVLKGALLGSVVGLSWYIYATNQLVPFLLLGGLPILVLSLRTRIRHPVWIIALMFFCLVSYPAVEASFSKGNWFPIRTTLPETRNYDLQFNLETLKSVHRSFSQIFINSEDEWFTRHGGALTLGSKILVAIGLGVIAIGMQRMVGVLRAGYVCCALMLGILPAVLSSEQALRRELIALLVLVFVEGLGWLWLLNACAFLGKIRVVCILAVFVAVSLLSWNEYANSVRLPEVNGNRYYRGIATLMKQFSSASPILAVSTNTTTQAMLRMHVDFVLKDKNTSANILNQTFNANYQTVDEVPKNVSCDSVCRSKGTVILFESVLYPSMKQHFQGCTFFSNPKNGILRDYHDNPIVYYLRCT